MTEARDLPAPHVTQAAQALEGFARLLLCVDPLRWESAGRPTPPQLAALAFIIGARLAVTLSDVPPLAA